MTDSLARGSWIWRVAAVVWVLISFWMSSRADIPDPFQAPEWLPIDKFAHFALFMVLAALLYLAGLRASLAVAAAAVYGVTDEVHQMFVPGRSPDVRDWLADVLGAAAGAWVAASVASRAGLERDPVE